MKISSRRLCAAIVAVLAFCTAARAGLAPSSTRVQSDSASGVARVDYRGRYDCGADYPCRLRHRPGERGQVYIERNYGTVNIYESGDDYRWRPRSRCRYTGCCDRYACGGRRPEPKPMRNPYPAERPAPCGSSPCDQNCGPHCWFHRFRRGYCGQGCGFYREKARIGEQDRTFRGPNVAFYTEPAPAIERPREDDETVMQDRDSERTRDLDGRAMPPRDRFSDTDREPSSNRDGAIEGSKDEDDGRYLQPYPTEYPRKDRK